jgi:hypothetical protein
MRFPWIKFLLKSASVFGSGLSLTANALTVTKTEFGWIIFLGPPIMMLLTYWGGVADSMPAPWVTPAEARRTADELATAHASMHETPNLEDDAP